MPFRCTLPHLVISIVLLLALESGTLSLFFFLSFSLSVVPTLVLSVKFSGGSGSGLRGRIFAGLVIRPREDTCQPLRSFAFAAVTRDMSSACEPSALLLRFFGGGPSAAALFSKAILEMSKCISIESWKSQLQYTHLSLKSGFASPKRNFAPFHVDPLSKFMPFILIDEQDSTGKKAVPTFR